MVLTAPPPLIMDTNGKCGLFDADDTSKNGRLLAVSDDSISVQRNDDAVTFVAVESDPASLVGAYVPEANNGAIRLRA